MLQERVFRVLAKVIFLMTCLLSTMDTHLFVYPSLSRYLLMEVCILALTFITILYKIANRDEFRLSRISLFIVLWVAYIAIHAFVLRPGEHYRVYYLCITLMLIIVLAETLRCRLLSRVVIEAVLLLTAVINLIYILGQCTGIVESGNPFFGVTGCNENPTVTAMFLVGCIPMILAGLKKPKLQIIYTILLACTVLGIVLLRCRTAYIGATIEVCILLTLHFRDRLKPFLKHWSIVATTVIGVAVLAVVGGNGLYKMKKDSADGRLLIWKLSATMIAEKPMGYGYGLFEKNYNLRQADYFAHEKHTDTEERNADFVYMPYNDYLEQGVEGGIPGMFFLIMFFFIIIRAAIRQRQREATAVLCAFAVMSMFNFVYTSIAPWMLLICYSSFVIDKYHEMACIHLSKHILSIFLFSIFFIISFKVFEITQAQLKLKRLVVQAPYVDDIKYAEIEKLISTSEAFWTHRAINCMKKEDYNAALANLTYARNYSSSPILFRMEVYCYERTKIISPEGLLDTLSNMMPIKYLLNR